MSLKNKAKQVRAKGNQNSSVDSVLAHISPKEAQLLKMYGGSGRTDPQTGLPHFDEGAGAAGGGDGGSSGFGGGTGDGWGGEGRGTGGHGVGSTPGGSLGGGGLGGIGTGLSGDVSAWGEGADNSSDMPDVGTLGRTMADAEGESATTLGQTAPIGGDLGGGTWGMTDNMFSPDIGDFRGAEGLNSFGEHSADINTPSLAGAGVEDNEDNQSKRAFRAVSSLLGIPTSVPGVMSTMGTMFAGPLGGILGNVIGNSIMGSVGQRSPEERAAMSTNGGAQGLGTGGGFANALGGLAQLYAYNQASKANKEQASALSNGQDSPYAQAMRQQLERRDAAAGRRSQYGPREVELQAKLAALAAQNAPARLNLANQRQSMTGQGLAALYSGLQNSGLLGKMSGGLSSLFSQDTGNSYYNNGGVNVTNQDNGYGSDQIFNGWGG